MSFRLVEFSPSSLKRTMLRWLAFCLHIRRGGLRKRNTGTAGLAQASTQWVILDTENAVFDNYNLQSVIGLSLGSPTSILASTLIRSPGTSF